LGVTDQHALTLLSEVPPDREAGVTGLRTIQFGMG